MAKFRYHQKIALDEGRPLDHRMSHARSAALVVSFRLGVARSDVIERVRVACGVDITRPATDEQLSKAMQVLEDIRSADPLK